MDDRHEYDAFFDGAADVEETLREGRQVLEEAREAFAPASLGPDPDEGTAEPGPLERWLGRLCPDRLVTFPLWAMGVVALHALILVVLLCVVASGGALMLFIATVMDALIGVPVTRPCAWAIAALASVGTFVSVFQSFMAKIRQFPW